MKRIMHIVGNRPQFIKLAPVIRQSAKHGNEDIIVHSGQHFDENMSDIFFEELDIPKPNYNLQVSGGSHAQMTGKMMMKLESVINLVNPDVVVVYGDTNTTLAAALTAKKMGKPIAHVEAGERTGNEWNPEEINRQVVDRISSMLFAADKPSFENLIRENMSDRAFFTGDVMYDAFKYYKNVAIKNNVFNYIPDKYVLMTWHRAENTSDVVRMSYLLDLIEAMPFNVVCPMHPRTRAKLTEFGLIDRADNLNNFFIMEPVGYIEMIKLSSNAEWILTDSGGLSKESYFAGKRCLFMVDLKVWEDLVNCNWIVRLSNNLESALEQMNDMNKTITVNEMFFGQGNAAETIMDIISQYNEI